MDSGNGLGFLGHFFQNRFFAIISAFGADVVSPDRGPAVLTGREGRGNRLVMCAPFCGTLLGMAMFWIWHDYKD
jgi:hypothetical protein